MRTEHNLAMWRFPAGRRAYPRSWLLWLLFASGKNRTQCPRAVLTLEFPISNNGGRVSGVAESPQHQRRFRVFAHDNLGSRTSDISFWPRPGRTRISSGFYTKRADSVLRMNNARDRVQSGFRLPSSHFSRNSGNVPSARSNSRLSVDDDSHQRVSGYNLVTTAGGGGFVERPSTNVATVCSFDRYKYTNTGTDHTATTRCAGPRRARFRRSRTHLPGPPHTGLTLR
jgi:hypothetical protein